MRAWVAAIVVVEAVSGCQYGPYQFACTDDASCGAGGKCEPGFNLCSFANASCPGGRAFGDLAGENAGKCVGSQPAGAPACYGTASIPVCFATRPTGTINVSTLTTFDTGASTGTSLTCATPISGGNGDCVLIAADITIAAMLRVTGTKPLVLIATGMIDIMSGGMIDVGSYRGQTPETGAGSDPPGGCASGKPPAAGGGGAGGSFLGLGGAGGNGDDVGSGGGVPGAASSAPTTVRGGCSGQPGYGFVSTDAGAGGHGGGAVFLIAGTMFVVDGTINAGGDGGHGGGNRGSDPPAGGGGGGAGGMIGFDAPNVSGTGTLIANGGGGGEGNGKTLPGRPGADATSTNAAPGGGGDTIGGDGGDGSAGPANGSGMSVVVNATGGGGGGGGGAGLIKVPAGANLSGASVSPAPTL